MGLWHTQGSPNINQQKENNLKNYRLCRPDWKECEKKDKYLDLARELKKVRNMKVMMVPIVIGALATVAKGLLKDLEDLEVGGRVETIQMTALLWTNKILRRVLETWGDLLLLKLIWKTISWCEKKGVNNNHNNRFSSSILGVLYRTFPLGPGSREPASGLV